MRDTFKYVDEVTPVLAEALTPDEKRDLLLELMLNYLFQKHSGSLASYFSREEGAEFKRYLSERLPFRTFGFFRDDPGQSSIGDVDLKSQKYFMYRAIHSFDHRQWNDPVLSKKIDGLFEKLENDMDGELRIDLDQKYRELLMQAVDFQKRSRFFLDQKDRPPLEQDKPGEEVSSTLRKDGIKESVQQYLKAHELQEDLDLKMQKDPALADQMALQLTVNYMLKNFNADERKRLKHRARQRANRRALIGAALILAGALVLSFILSFFL
ncbi:MAG: hypothetical protein KBG02_12435 [Haliscomenobacter sp.]|nr:hypothetical protein [Haliscomenobacter sp.]MBP9077664.1 hypothetical protein [Haliscomenobacter sp.]MBP9874753.1 hypothetical protein [Haliscomenobacter sp.]